MVLDVKERVAIQEIVIEVGQEADGGFIAEASGESIFTQARYHAACFDPPAPGTR